MRSTRPATAPIRSVLLGLALGAGIGPGPTRGQDRSADALLKLSPPNAAATLVVEGFRESVREFLDSPLGRGLYGLPSIQRWRGSEAGRVLEITREDIEAVLGVPPETIRDEVLGDAVVLAIVPDPGGGEPSGLLLTRARDPKLLARIIRVINAGEHADGTLLEVVDRKHAGLDYHLRKFAPGIKPDDSYATLDGDLFAWSNSEGLIQDVLDRRAGRKPGLGADPRFQEVRRALPSTAAALLALDPAALQAGIDPDGDPIAILLRNHVKSLKYVGVALELRGHLELHAVETYARGDEAGAFGPTDSISPPDDLLAGIPTDPLAFLAGPVDFSNLFEGLYRVLGPEEKGRADQVVAVASGLLMGLNVRDEVLPRLGPAVVAYLVNDGTRTDASANSGGLEPRALDGIAVVLAVELSGDQRLADAIENGLRTLNALAKLDTRGVPARGLTATIVSRVEPGLLVIGTSARAVAEFGGAGGPSSDFRELRAHAFSDAQAFGYVDIKAIVKFAESRRDVLAAWLAEGRGGDADAAARDLDEVLALARLFRAGYYARDTAPDRSSTHQIFGLVPRERAEVR